MDGCVIFSDEILIAFFGAAQVNNNIWLVNDFFIYKSLLRLFISTSVAGIDLHHLL